MGFEPGHDAADGGVSQIIEAVRLAHVPDLRCGVFDVAAERRSGGLVLCGEATHDGAVAELLKRLQEGGMPAADEVVRLPDASLGSLRHAVVRAALAPVYAFPRLPGTQISQLVLGMRVDLLSRAGEWLRIRGEDGYIGWVHSGYLQEGAAEWALGWERGTGGEPVVSLGADLIDADGRVLLRLPWGARLIRHSGAYVVPDGLRGDIVNGEVVDVDRLADRFPPRGESIARTARRWLGAPYIWGGVSLHGVDCSGFTQAVLWMHGVALPRDSDMQAAMRLGVEIDPGATDLLRPGDLLFFAEAGQRVSHVVISLGGSQVIHSALNNGGVAANDLQGSLPLEQRLRRMLVRVRRVLPD
jgi:gamma-D-glutamyl-L-lysine dipeptidyl-peptidase